MVLLEKYSPKMSIIRGEYKIKINNEKLKNKIISVVSNYDWKRYIKGIAMRRIKQYHIIDVLCREIPEIE